MLVGNTVTDTIEESDVRVMDELSYVNVYQNNFFQRSGTGNPLKSALRMSGKSFLTVRDNTLQGDTCWMGPFPGENGVDRDGQITEFLVAENNRITGGNFYLCIGLRKAVFRNNVFSTNESRAFLAQGEYSRSQTSDASLVKDLYIVNNTRMNGPNDAQFLSWENNRETGIRSTKFDTRVRLVNIHLANNLMARTSYNASQKLLSSPVRLFQIYTDNSNPQNQQALADRWEQELDPVLSPNTTRWWVRNNVWGYNPFFRLDLDTLRLTDVSGENGGRGWNTVNALSGGTTDTAPRESNSSPATAVYGVSMQGSTAGTGGTPKAYQPIDTKNGSGVVVVAASVINRGSRVIAGAESGGGLEVARFDYYDRLRPTSNVSAGAVELNPLS